MITGPAARRCCRTWRCRSSSMSTGWSTGWRRCARPASRPWKRPKPRRPAGRSHMADCATLTLHRLANTWYTGANVPGKAQGVMPYTGGVGPYRSICNEVVGRGMLGFRLTGPNVAEQCNDGEVVRLQPDVRLVLGMLAEMNLPQIESAGRAGRARLRHRIQQGPSCRSAGRRGRRAARCKAPTVRCPIVSIGRQRRGHIRSWSISTAAAGCSVTSNPTIRSAATCAGAAE